MIEFNCAYCGNVKRVHRTRDASRFCSKSCAVKYRHEHKQPKNMRPKGILWDKECVFNPDAVHCVIKDCERCGWNPEVAKARSEAIAGARG